MWLLGSSSRPRTEQFSGSAFPGAKAVFVSARAHAGPTDSAARWPVSIARHVQLSDDPAFARAQERAIVSSAEHNPQAHFVFTVEDTARGAPSLARLRAILADTLAVHVYAASRSDAPSVRLLVTAAAHHGAAFVLATPDVVLPDLSPVLALASLSQSGPWAVAARDRSRPCGARLVEFGVDVLIGVSRDVKRAAAAFEAVLRVEPDDRQASAFVFASTPPHSDPSVEADRWAPIDLCPYLDVMRVRRSVRRPSDERNEPSAENTQRAAIASCATGEAATRARCDATGLVARWSPLASMSRSIVCPVEVPLVFPSAFPDTLARAARAALDGRALGTVVVTAISSDHYAESQLMFESVRANLDREMVFIVFDLGLREKQRAKLRAARVSVIPWDPAGWPEHFAIIRSYAWKAAFVHAVMATERASLVLWADAGARFGPRADLAALRESLATGPYGLGVMVAPLNTYGFHHTMNAMTHPASYASLGLERADYDGVEQFEATIMAFSLEHPRLRCLFGVWFSCGFERACIAPVGSSQNGCPQQPTGTPSECHRQDQSAINMAFHETYFASEPERRAGLYVLSSLANADRVRGNPDPELPESQS